MAEETLEQMLARQKIRRAETMAKMKGVIGANEAQIDNKPARKKPSPAVQKAKQQIKKSPPPPAKTDIFGRRKALDNAIEGKKTK